MYYTVYRIEVALVHVRFFCTSFLVPLRLFCFVLLFSIDQTKDTTDYLVTESQLSKIIK